MDGEPWRALVNRVSKSWTWLKQLRCMPGDEYTFPPGSENALEAWVLLGNLGVRLAAVQAASHHCFPDISSRQECKTCYVLRGKSVYIRGPHLWKQINTQRKPWLCYHMGHSKDPASLWLCTCSCSLACRTQVFCLSPSFVSLSRWTFCFYFSFENRSRFWKWP